MIKKIAEENKTKAIEFFQMITQGKIIEAYEKYVNPIGKHHNVFYPAGFMALQKGMIENHSLFPNKKLILKNVLAEGELVSLHSHLILVPGKEIAVMHLVRFCEGKIVEMWDCGQSIANEMINSDGAF